MKLLFVRANDPARILWTVEEPLNITLIPKVGQIVEAPANVPQVRSGRVAEKPFRRYGAYYGQLDVTVPLTDIAA